MAGRSPLNLALDEIIQQKMLASRRQKIPNRSISNSRISSQSHNIHKKTTRLAGRLSFSNTRRNRDQDSKRSVHSRLNMNRNKNVVSRNRSSYGDLGIKSKGADGPMHVRMTNGAVVKGLRSDQLLLQETRKRRNLTLQSKIDRIRERNRSKERRPTAQTSQRSYARPLKRLGVSSQVFRKDARPTMVPNAPYGRALTVSFNNNIKPHRPLVSRTRYFTPEPTSSSASYSSPSPPPSPPPMSRRQKKVSLKPASVIPERPPPPKPHRQVLDPQIKREIALLQGVEEDEDVGPGPGVKGFKMIPMQTKSSLSDRFSQGKME